MRDLGLKGKRVVVTGAAGGLGRAFARAFADAGAVVTAVDIAAEGAVETARMIARSGGVAYSGSVDVTNADSCRALGRVDEFATEDRSAIPFLNPA